MLILTCSLCNLSTLCACVCQLQIPRSAFETAAWRALNTSGGQRTQLLKNSGSEWEVCGAPRSAASPFWESHWLFLWSGAYIYVPPRNKNKIAAQSVVIGYRVCKLFVSCCPFETCSVFLCGVISGTSTVYAVKPSFIRCLFFLGDLWRKRKTIPHPT